MKELYVTILAGGVGKRMQSDIPKVLHQVKGEAMVIRLLNQIIKLDPAKIIIVVGKFHIAIKNEIEKHINDNRIVYVNQPVPLGTGDAVKCTLGQFENNNIVNIILNGDVPMLQYSTIKEIYESYLQKQSKFLITSVNIDNPTGNGRIFKDINGNFKEIIEEKDCNPEQKLIKLVNCGIYICDSSVCLKYIPRINNNNSQNEYYLTDLVKIYLDNPSHKVDLFILPPEKEIEIYNINTKEQLLYVEKLII